MTNTAYNSNLEKIESLLFGFAMKLTHNKENAKDLMQETLMRSYNHKDRFTEGTNFKAWVTTIMYNSFVNNYRKKKTRNKVVKPIEDFSYMIANKSVEGNGDSVIMMKELKKMVGNLSDSYKVPFEMMVQGYQYDEIAKKINLPMGTVKSRIFYARKKLQGMVNSRYGSIENVMAA